MYYWYIYVQTIIYPCRKTVYELRTVEWWWLVVLWCIDHGLYICVTWTGRTEGKIKRKWLLQNFGAYTVGLWKRREKLRGDAWLVGTLDYRTSSFASPFFFFFHSYRMWHAKIPITFQLLYCYLRHFWIVKTHDISL